MSVIEETGQLSSGLYRRGWLIFGYGLIWVIVLAVGFAQAVRLFDVGNTTTAILLAAGVAATLAGGLGGATAMLQSLARHLSIEHNFHRHSLLTYLRQPLIGLLAGGVSLFLITLPGALLVNYASTRTLALAETAATSTFVALYLLLAWIAGYYQTNVLAKIKPTAGSTKELTSVPPDSPLAFKVWTEQQRRVIHWANTWGVFIFVYGLVWLLVLLAGLLGNGFLFPVPADSQSPWLNLLAAGWPASLAGGIGGVIGMLYDLYRRISFARDFDRQHIIAYLTLPLTGLALGGVAYLFIASGYLSWKSLTDQAPPVVEAPSVIISYLVLGWVVGFRQQSLYSLIRRLIQTIINFFRYCFSLLSPKMLWDQASRTDALSEIAQQRELFRPIERDRRPSTKR